MFYENFSPLEEFGGGDWGPPFPRRFYAPNVTPAGRPADDPPPPPVAAVGDDDDAMAVAMPVAVDMPVTRANCSWVIDLRARSSIDSRERRRSFSCSIGTGRARIGGVGGGVSDAFKKLENREETRPPRVKKQGR